MRVLFTAIPEKSIFLSMVPLAWALRTAGHEVRFASQPSFADTITQAGLTAVPVGRDVDLWRIARLTPETLEEIRAGLPEPWDIAANPTDTTWEDEVCKHVEIVDEAHRPDNFPMIAGLVDFARQWQPDLILWEPLTYAGAIAAKACGAAHARLMWSIDVFGVTRDLFLRLNSEQPADSREDPLADWLGSYGRKYGFDYTEDMATGHFTIDQLPDSLRMEADLHYLPMRYVPYGGPAVVPSWLRTPPERPRVALTLGITATGEFAGYIANVQDILDSLADLDIEIVATIAEAEQRKLTRVPANTRVVSYVPLHALVPTCSAVINHTGPGTFLTTALHGVPQLNVPWDFDEPELARRAAQQGATIDIRADRATGPAVREALQRLLTEPTFTNRARSLRDEIHALPSPNQLVPQLEELTAKYRTTGGEEKTRCAS